MGICMASKLSQVSLPKGFGKVEAVMEKNPKVKVAAVSAKKPVVKKVLKVKKLKSKAKKK
jgi:hypothetical protein